jgi:phage/plasmid primase-like uncharacterized protein
MADGSYDVGSSPANSGGRSRPGLDRDTVKFALEGRAEDLFRQAWGDPEKSSGKGWRARSSSARSMVMRGAKRGQWFDHKAALSGDILDFFAVELCGLSKANDDFPRVMREAAAYCGLSDGTGPDLDAMRARKAAQDAEGAKQAARETQSKAALVKALQARAEPLVGSPAAAYLASRGIHALPEMWSYLPPVQGLDVLSPHRPALVAWAVNAAGQVTGGQRVLILEDGSKAPEEPRKVAFGSIGGNAAKIRAQVAGAPLCIAEGPETAAAIAQATGFEVWAVFGVSGFASAPAPLDRQVILCPDQDASSSPAAKAFDTACDAQVRRGVDLWIARAPEPKGSKRDLADTLQDSGPEAVARAVKGAVKFTPRDGKGQFTGAGALPAEPLPMPDFLSPDVARERIREAVRAFLVKAAKWQEAKAAWEAYCDNEARGMPPAEVVDLAAMPAPVLAIKASPGAGKSWIAREVLAEFGLESFGGGDGLFTAPTLALAEEAAAHAKELQAGWHVTRGRSAINPANGQPMCARSEMAEQAARAGLHVKPTLCELKQKDGPPVLCPHHGSCAYLRQWDAIGQPSALRFEASSYLALPGDGSGRATGLRVIDESIWQRFTREADLPLDRWQRPRNVVAPAWKSSLTEADKVKAAEAAADLTRAAQDVLSALQRGESPLTLSYTAEDYRAFAQAERGPNVLSATNPSADDGAIAAALDQFEAAGDPDAGKRAAVWRILADCAERGLPNTERLRLVRDVPANGTKEKRDVLRANWVADPPRDAPALLLDADANPEILERMFPGADLMQVDLRPNAEVLQVTDKTGSKASFLRNTKRAELVSLVRAEVLRDRWHDAGGVLAIGTKAVVQQIFEDAGQSFKGMNSRLIADFMRATPLHGARWLWFGPSSLGLNTWQDFGTAIVIGREELPLTVLQDYARSMFGDTGEPLNLISEAEGSNMPEAALPYLMADGSGAAVKARAHPDRRARALQEQGRELATRQGFERLRLATAEKRKRVVLVCKVPIPGLPVDRLVTMQELAPDRLEAAMAEAAQRGGVLRLSAAGLAQDAPETFPTAEAAKDWLRREGKARVNGGMPLIRYTISGAPPLKPVRVRLKVQGQRGPKPTPALVIIPGNPQEMAEAHLGPLAMFEVVDASSASLNAAETWGHNAGKNCEAFLKAGKDQAAQVARIPTYYSVSNTEPVSHSKRRLVVIPKAETIDSTLMAQFIEARQQVRGWWRNIDKARSISAAAFA